MWTTKCVDDYWRLWVQALLNDHIEMLDGVDLWPFIYGGRSASQRGFGGYASWLVSLDAIKLNELIYMPQCSFIRPHTFFSVLASEEIGSDRGSTLPQFSAIKINLSCCICSMTYWEWESILWVSLNLRPWSPTPDVASLNSEKESIHQIKLIEYYHSLYNRGFSCDVITCQFCKSSYSWPPCGFPLSMARYRKIQQNVPLLFI